MVNLAWPGSMTDEEHLAVVTALRDVVVRRRAVRLVHTSTAVVVGRTPLPVVDESTPCSPVTPYERAKFKVERALSAAAEGMFPLTILRPTAIFGPGLQNLVSLVESLRHGSRFENYARSALFGRRILHLVPVETVAAALLFVSLAHDRADDRAERCYIVSADDEPGGDFRSVESRLRRQLGLRAALPAIPVPRIVLRAALRAAGRSDVNPTRIYDGTRLRASGFVPPVSLDVALDRYAAWYREQACRAT